MDEWLNECFGQPYSAAYYGPLSSWTVGYGPQCRRNIMSGWKHASVDGFECNSQLFEFLVMLTYSLVCSCLSDKFLNQRATYIEQLEDKQTI